MQTEKDVSFQDVADFAARVLRVEASVLTPATARGSLPEWDSVQHVRLVMEMGASFGVDAALDEIPRLNTLADFHARILAEGRKGATP